jgi:hypothetical protein
MLGADLAIDAAGFDEADLQPISSLAEAREYDVVARLRGSDAGKLVCHYTPAGYRQGVGAGQISVAWEPATGSVFCAQSREIR